MNKMLNKHTTGKLTNEDIAKHSSIIKDKNKVNNDVKQDKSTDKGLNIMKKMHGKLLKGASGNKGGE